MITPITKPTIGPVVRNDRSMSATDSEKEEPPFKNPHKYNDDHEDPVTDVEETVGTLLDVWV